MDGLSVPLSPIWHSQMSMVCSPDGGLLYLAGRSTIIVYIPPITDSKAVKMPNIFPVSCVKHIVCDIDWSKTKYFATFDMEDAVSVYDLDQLLIVKAHRGHSHTSGRNRNMDKRRNNNHQRHDESGGALCFLRNRSLLSNNENTFVLFCLASNKYTTFSIDRLFEREPVTIMKGSPYSDEIVAMGSKRGLVTIVNIANKTVIHKFRGHDTSVSSLEWMQMSFSGAQQTQVVQLTPSERPKAVSTVSANEIKLRGQPVPIVAADDVFDIYDFNDAADEFGVVANPSYSSGTEKRENVASNENFNFVEACLNLKEDILQVPKMTTDSNINSISSDFEKLNMSSVNIESANDIPQSQRDYISKQLASAMLDTTQSSEESKEESKMLNEATESVVPPDTSSEGSFVNITDTSLLEANQLGKVTFLASGAKEHTIWVWNVDAGKSAQKLQMKRANKNSPVQDKMTMVCWVNEHTIMANSPKGEVLVFELIPTGNDMIISSMKENIYTDFGVNGIYSCTSSPGADPVIWTKSVNHQLQCSTVSKKPKILRSFTTLSWGMQAIAECPHDFNKIAIAGTNRRIQIMNLSSLTTEHIFLASYSSMIKSKVLYLAWHPKAENLLAFSTEEGRVGVFDINKSNATPQLVTPFTNAAVYQISWALVSEGPDQPDTAHYVLLVCSDGKLFSIPETGENKYTATHIATKEQIMSVSANKKYIAVGTKDGYALLYKLFIKGPILTKYLWSAKICSKYVSECAWSPINPNKLALACSANGFKVFECVKDDEIVEIGSFMDMTGVTYLKWSNEFETNIVLTGFDGTVRVFETDSMSCTSIYQSTVTMMSAIFMPSDENYVMCAGQRETVYIFDRRTRMDEQKKPPKNDKKYIDTFMWGSLLINDTQRLIALEKKKNHRYWKRNGPKQLKGVVPDGDESDVVIISEPVSDHEHGPSGVMQLNYNTICYLTNKEFNKDALECLELLVTGNDEYKNKHNSLLFGDRGAVRCLLAAELANHKLSMTDSVAHVLIPQLVNELEAEITRIATDKGLTEQHLARAPLVSYAFWKQCCQWYFKQMIELGSPLMALPYIMSHDMSEAISVLCSTNYYREAWILAQLNRESGDPAFKMIVDKWLEWLDSKGNLDGAAYISAAVGDNERALALLQKRRNPTEVIEKIINILQTKIASK